MARDPDGVTALAEAQCGVVTRRQLRACGVSDAVVSRRVRSGTWAQLHRGVLVVTAPVTWRGRVWAAQLRAGDGDGPAGVAAGWAAAALCGFAELAAEERVELILPRTTRRAQTPGIRLRWSPLAAMETAVRDGIVCTSPLRALRDLLPRVDRTAGVVLCDSALRTRAVSPGDLAALAGPRGWRRVPARARVGSESVFETLVRLELLAAGLPEPDLQHVVRLDGSFVARVDLAWPGRKIAVEADGAAVHANAAALRADLRRQNLLVRAGWTVLRFTWADLGRIAPVVIASMR